MSSRIPRITAKELIRFLKSNGFQFFDAKGSHQHFVHLQTGRKVTIPVHSGRVIGPGLFKSILKQAGLEWDEK